MPIIRNACFTTSQVAAGCLMQHYGSDLKGHGRFTVNSVLFAMINLWIF